MKTAVEWLIDMLVTENEITLKGENYKLFDQAKQMEKEQIIEAYETAMETDIYNEPLKIGKDYYNETFKSEEDETRITIPSFGIKI